MKIGVFDSGFGGLTVLKEVRKFLPEYSYVYLGDNARAPYGIRSQETILEYTRQAVDFLTSEQGCGIVVVACNTASAEALEKIQQEYSLNENRASVHIFGVLIPTAQEAASITKNNHVGVIATRGTVESGAFVREIHKSNASIHVTQKSTPLLVPLIEEGWAERPETNMILKKYLRAMKNANIDTLVLGCTHYPILSKAIRRIMGKKVSLVASSEASGKRFLLYLKQHLDLEKQLVKDGKVQYFTTDDPNRFIELGQKVFKGDLTNVQQAHLV